jgi:hypothetical protein
MSERDIAATGVLSRRQIQTMKLVASIPKAEFEALVESDDPPTVTQLCDLARRRAGSSPKAKAKRCPHCGGLL